jgi:hypothetical protein
MDNAAYLFVAAPGVYFSALLPPFPNGLLTLLPLLGVIALVTGGIIGLRRRNKRLLWFIAPVALIQVMLAFTGWTTLRYESHVYAGYFLIAMVLGATALAWRAARDKVAAALLSGFIVTYMIVSVVVAVVSVGSRSI